MSTAPTLRVVLDANILLQIALCDTVMRAAEARIYDAYWSDTILDEMERNLVMHGRATPESARRRRIIMQNALPGGTIQGHEARIATMTNDPKDRHILAAAVHINVRMIVTHNRCHFPSHALLPHGIEAQSPDTFLGLLLDLAPDTMMQIIVEQAEDLKNPPQSIEQVLNNLLLEAPTFAGAVRERLRLR